MDRLTTEKPVKDMTMTELALNGCYIDKTGWARYRDYDTDIDARDFARKLLERYEPDLLIPEETGDLEELLFDELQYGALDHAGSLVALVYMMIFSMAELRAHLAAYEDTGLEPEKIAELTKSLLVGMNKRNRAMELLQAESEGRLIVLPCKKESDYAGLKVKYVVVKTDTGELVENCFVLRPDKDPAARLALEAYAQATDNQVLASDITEWIGDSGKVIVLPCKEGTPIWKLSPRLNSAPEIEKRYFNLMSDRNLQFGKDFFPTRKEAEAALEEYGGANNG